ncbi:hypothetical protein FRX31_003291 [Thalictrum thalictroides]|uniref:Uncharacterized protein n=1 Tax=Thalictrum thalictroides TaxID=46969 RepID=A0A7J6XC99_THATH|nr:hypothetical protein FRX31_003291 [Thalictrum thalictroides]
MVGNVLIRPFLPKKDQLDRLVYVHIPYGMVVWSTRNGTRPVITKFMKEIGQALTQTYIGVNLCSDTLYFHTEAGLLSVLLIVMLLPYTQEPYAQTT